MKRFAAVVITAILLNSIAMASTLDWFSFNYGSFSGGMREYSIYEYNGDYYLDAQGLNGVELNISEKKIGESDVNDLLEILADHNIKSWDGFEQHDDTVSDGDGFAIDIAYKNGTQLSASGYEIYPDGYWSAWAELTGFFEELTA